MKSHIKKNSSETLTTEDPLLINHLNDKHFYSNEEIFEKKWQIFIVNCLLFLVLTMAIDAPQQMQFILETKHNYTTLKYLFFSIIVNFISCFTRRIINNFRKIYSNRAALLITYLLLIFGQALFSFGLFVNSYLIIISGRIFLAFAKDPLSILIISQVSKVFKHHYGNIPLAVLNTTTIIGNIINCILLPSLLTNNSIYYSSNLYLIVILIGILLMAIIYFIEYNLEVNAINETFVRNELTRKRSGLRKTSDFSVESNIAEYRFFDLRNYVEEFRHFSKEFYFVAISGALSFLQMFNYTFMLNDYYTINYQFSIEKSGNIIAAYFTLCLFLMPSFVYLSKQLKNKLNFLIISNVCAILLSIFSLMKIKFYYINILLLSIEYAILTGIISECFGYLVDQENYYFAFEFNRILLYFAVASGALICGLVVTIFKSSKFIFPFYFFIVANIVSIKLLLKVKEKCANL